MYKVDKYQSHVLRVVHHVLYEQLIQQLTEEENSTLVNHRRATFLYGRIASTMITEEEVFSVQMLVPQHLIPLGMVAAVEVAGVQEMLLV